MLSSFSMDLLVYKWIGFYQWRRQRKRFPWKLFDTAIHTYDAIKWFRFDFDYSIKKSFPWYEKAFPLLKIWYSLQSCLLSVGDGRKIIAHVIPSNKYHHRRYITMRLLLWLLCSSFTTVFGEEGGGGKNVDMKCQLYHCIQCRIGCGWSMESNMLVWIEDVHLRIKSFVCKRCLQLN